MPMTHNPSARARALRWLGWEGKTLLGAMLWGAILCGAANTLRAQKPEAVPIDPQPPRTDLLPTNIQPSRFDLRRTPNPAAQTASQEFIVSPDDELSVDVLDVAELSKTYRVSPTGVINMPLLSKPVTAAGLTLQQLGDAIAEQLQAAGMVAHPHVTIQVAQSRLHAVAIAGAVRKPQMYQIYGKTTVLDALAQAEGLADEAGMTAIITRGDIGNRVSDSDPMQEAKAGTAASHSGTISVDLKRLLEDGDASQNYDLYPGDRISVQRAGIVYVVGAVKRPGGFVLKDDRQQMTILKALALSEFTTSTAAAKRTVIVRKAAGGNQEIPVDLAKILEGRDKDRVLLAGDILFIPESAARRAVNRAGEAAAQAAVVLLYRF
jgi:polysaccharide export outer membrane protein